MERREKDGRIHITLDADDIRRLNNGQAFEIISVPNPGKRIVIDQLPEMTFHEWGIDMGEIIYHIEEETP